MYIWITYINKFFKIKYLKHWIGHVKFKYIMWIKKNCNILYFSILLHSFYT
jgi:hypothetical protein